MEKRKIQRTGGSSFTITLPKKWIKDNKLKEQDAVFLSSNKSGSLILNAGNFAKKRDKRKLNLDGLSSDEIKREIIANYILGAEEVDIFEEEITRDCRAIVRETLGMLIGFEIIEESTKNIFLKNILSSSKFSFEQSIEKMFAMSQSMLEDGLKAFLEKNKNVDKVIYASTSETYAGSVELGSAKIPTGESVPLSIVDISTLETVMQYQKSGVNTL